MEQVQQKEEVFELKTASGDILTVTGNKIRLVRPGGVLALERTLIGTEKILLNALLDANKHRIDRLPDEPFFVLLGRDPQAPALVAKWAAERKRCEPDSPKADSAVNISVDMIEFKNNHPDLGMSMDTYAQGKTQTVSDIWRRAHHLTRDAERYGIVLTIDHKLQPGELPGGKFHMVVDARAARGYYPA